jgi:DNA modification methylase
MGGETLRLEWMYAEELDTNSRNWHLHPYAQEAALRDAKKEIGWAGAFLYNERTKRLIDGHLRKKIAKKRERIPFLVGSWSEEEEAKILATLDPIGMMAQVNKGALEALLGSVRFESSAITSLLETMVGEAASKCIVDPAELVELADQIERADELKKKWKTVKGQLWEAPPSHRVVCGDSTDSLVLAALRQGADPLHLICTDPPYGVDYRSKTAWMAKHGAQRRRAAIENDALKPNDIRRLFGNALKLAASNATPGAVIYATVPSGSLLPFFIAALEDGGFTFKHSLVWVKNAPVLGRGDYNYQHELILYGWILTGPHYFVADRAKSSVFEVDRPQSSPFHATTKPLELIARLIMNSSRKHDIVYDPFCGSGTTLLACHQLGRIGFGVELDPGYVAVTLERLSALGLKPKLIATVKE